MWGIIIGMIELSIFFGISYLIREKKTQFKKMDPITYYWLMMTILTFIWEISFILTYDKVVLTSYELLINKEHVWVLDYNLSYILPWKTAEIFYAEYGVYADREYMLLENDWSRVIEGTHAIFCGFFALLAIILQGKARIVQETSVVQYEFVGGDERHKILGNKRFLITKNIAMGAQLMNSILYMANYFNQIHESQNVNYNTKEFPTGTALSKRPFMYVNIFWTFMPLYTILKSLYDI